MPSQLPTTGFAEDSLPSLMPVSSDGLYIGVLALLKGSALIPDYFPPPLFALW